MTAHTKGPWKIVTDHHFPRLATIEFLDGSKFHCLAATDDPLDMADLTLASAAPDLLRAAHTALYLLRGSGFSDKTQAIIDLRAAIAKAEGEWK